MESTNNHKYSQVESQTTTPDSPSSVNTQSISSKVLNSRDPSALSSSLDLAVLGKLTNKVHIVDLEDINLQKCLRDENSLSTNARTANNTIQKPRINPFASFTCAFGFLRDLNAASPIPTTKRAFHTEVQKDVSGVGYIQNGLKSYLRAIHSGEHHTFSPTFLESQTNATNITVGQLDAIKEHLIDVVKEVEHIDRDDAEVGEDLKIAYGHAQPWIIRTRQILTSAHVFYKINYVLASSKYKH